MKTKTYIAVMAACLFLSVPSLADLIAYEGFNYSTNNIGSMNGLHGGDEYPDYGWESAWKHNFFASKDDDSRIVSGSLTKEGVRSTGNRIKFFRDISRTLSKKVSGTEGTVWMSMFHKSDTSKVTGSWFLSDTTSTNGAVLTVSCSARNKATIKLDGADTGIQTGTAQRFYLLRIDFSAGGNTAWLWVNPDITAGEPGTASADAVKEYDSNWSFDKLTINNNSGFTNAYTVDEIRFADTFTEVVLATAPYSGTTVLVK